MEEFNRHTLKAAIANLKTHAPDDSVWTSIDHELDIDNSIAENIPKLAEYSPPDSIWENISGHIDQPVATPKIDFWKPLAIAASVAIVIGFMIFTNNTQLIANEKTSTEFSIEHYPIVKFDRKDGNNDLARNAIHELVKAQYINKEKPPNDEILAELKELDLAAIKLKKVMGKYETSNSLIEKLNEIEFERSQLMKKLISSI